MCPDQYFIAIMKTLNFYDQTHWSLKYNLELLHELALIADAPPKTSPDNIFGAMQQEPMKNHFKAKLQ